MKPDNGHFALERLNLADDPELCRAVNVVKQTLPDAQQLAALAANLTQLGIPVARTEPAVSNTVPSTARLKLLLGAGVVGPLALALLFLRPAAPAVAPAASEPVALPAERRLAPSVDAPRVIAVNPNPISTPRGDSGASDPVPSAAAQPTSSASNSATVSEPQPPVAPPTPASSESHAAATPTATTETARSARTTNSATPTSNSAGVVARPTEVALLREAQLALRGNPSQALALAEQHRLLFAHGAMVQERELIAISALARLGRHTAVLARAAQFERDFPSSPYRKQVSLLAQ